MIKVQTGKITNFEYESRSIIASFYPGQEILFDDNGENGETETPSETIKLDEIIQNGELSKNEKRRRLYAYLSEKTGHGLPWGILTGVRPTKLTMQRLLAGDTIPGAAKFMQDEYLTSPEKSVLAAVISARELKTMERVQGEGYSLYVGIPFCPSRCLYCSFASQPISAWEGKTHLYLDALFKELEATADIMHGQTLHSIYVGGGTPTALCAQDLKKVLEKINSLFDKTCCPEFTVEAGRPDSITCEKLEVIKAAGANRISINPQTMNDETLELIGRKHKTADIIEKFALAREMGFENINMDIILGLTGEMPCHVEHTIDAISALKPDSLTVHALAVKRASRLNMETAGAIMPGMGDDISMQMMQIATRGAENMGMVPYYLYRQKNMAGSLENVGYAVPGKEGIYNILMMEEMESIIACGAGTVTKRVCSGDEVQIKRCDCPKDVEQYIQRIDEMILRKRDLFA